MELIILEDLEYRESIRFIAVFNTLVEDREKQFPLVTEI
jgi:hypothetical protein